MYTIALIVLVGMGVLLAVYGNRRRKFGLTGAGILLAIAAGVFFGLLDFWGEMLWFEAMGYGRRFWEAVWVQVLAGMAGALIGAAFVALLTVGVPPGRRLVRIAVVVIGGLIGLLKGAANWEIILKFIHRERLQSGPAG
jgi:zinc transporter ZupT